MAEIYKKLLLVAPTVFIFYDTFFFGKLHLYFQYINDAFSDTEQVRAGLYIFPIYFIYFPITPAERILLPSHALITKFKQNIYLFFK